MRLNNTNKTGFINFIGTFFLLVISVALIIFVADKFFFHLFGIKSWLLLAAALFLAFIIYLRGRPFFMYDSDGEALNFKNRHFLSLLGSDANDEFPKYKLKDFEVVNALIFKRLYITIDSKKSNNLILKYDISYLSRKEVNDLKFSLNKAVKANRENNKN